ncbi:hypothetical protein LJR098_000861 [Rhizobium sp. LjRoot98]|uniref:hypothetical protein n=1 Tax=Rhizobium sp. LjRoot98 TaxID=3342345 RepID=UPI003ED0D1A7
MAKVPFEDVSNSFSRVLKTAPISLTGARCGAGRSTRGRHRPENEAAIVASPELRSRTNDVGTALRDGEQDRAETKKKRYPKAEVLHIQHDSPLTPIKVFYNFVGLPFKSSGDLGNSRTLIGQLFVERRQRIRYVISGSIE